jgi:hypothetical protein
MAIRTGFKRGSIGPSLRGRFYTYGSVHGDVVASWPAKRPKFLSDDQEASKKMFADCCLAMKLMWGDFIAYAAENSKGTPMLPRDALMAALYGNGPVIKYPDGTRVIPMASRINMSMMMDNLAWEPFSLLWRDEDTWTGLSAPLDTGALVFDPAQGYIWVNLNDITGGSPWHLHTQMTSTAINANSKGNQYIPFQDIVLQTLTIGGAWNMEAGIFAFIWRMTPGTDQLAEKLWEEELYLTPGGGSKMWVLNIPDIVLLAGQRYWIGARTAGASNTANTIIRTAGPTFGGLPIFPDPARYHLAQADPQPGHTLTFGSTTSVFAVGLKGR